jgi:hypothetical protein
VRSPVQFKKQIAQIIITMIFYTLPSANAQQKYIFKNREKKVHLPNRPGECRHREHIRRMHKQVPCTQRPFILLKRRKDTGIKIRPGEIHVLHRVMIWPSQVPVSQMRESLRLIGINTMTTKYNRVIFRFVVSEAR